MTTADDSIKHDPHLRTEKLPSIGDLPLWDAFLRWNRAQDMPLVKVGAEYAVAQVLCKMVAARATAAEEKPQSDSTKPASQEARSER